MLHIPERQLAAINAPTDPFPDFVGMSAWWHDMRRAMLGAADHNATVLITGPTGTGKELIARGIHAHSRRAKQPFVAADCAALTGELFASAMFGHVKGAFTGADADAIGCFRAADGGTLFLDEIGELPRPLQAMLLRVVEHRSVTPVGSVRPTPVDVRLIAATNRDLAAEVQAGHFREDLYFRLRVVPLATCGLDERPEDIPPLCQQILAKLSKDLRLDSRQLSPDALRLLQSRPWPGNVRQLRNVLECAVLAGRDPLITAERLRPLVAASQSDAGPGTSPNGNGRPPDAPYHIDASPTWRSLDDLEREHVLKTLEHTEFNQAAAARLLAISPRVLTRLLRKHDIAIPSARPGRPRRKPK